MAQVAVRQGEGGVVLQEAVPLSQSHLFTWQRSFYERLGVEAWRKDIVPHYITSNAFIARAYAQVILAWLQDLSRPGGTKKGKKAEGPVYILELGSGHGRFGFLCVSALRELVQQCPTPLPDFCWIMSDLAIRNLEFLQHHERLTPLVEAGLVDFAAFDAEVDDEIHLLHKGVTLRAGEGSRPMVMVANYLFDSLRQDVYYVHDGVVDTCHVALTSPREEPDLTDPELLQRVQVKWSRQPISVEDCTDPDQRVILEEYQKTLGDTAFGLPVGALECLRHVEALSGGKLLVLSADKGYNYPHEMLGRQEPTLVLHGSFSLMVDYHALDLVFRRRGGHSFHTAEREASLVISSFLLGGNLRDFSATTQAFATHIEHFGPIDFHLLQNQLVGQEKPPLQQVLLMLRLSDYDPGVLYNFRHTLKDHAGEGGESLKLELLRALPRVWARTWPIGDGRDIPFELARIYQKLGRSGEALEYYHLSLKWFGDDAVTWYNIGLCHHGLGEIRDALRCFDKSLQRDPNFGAAREWRLRVLPELR